MFGDYNDIIMTLKNWSGNLTYAASTVFYPDSTKELQRIVRSVKRIRVLGSRHSFNAIADHDQNLISFDKLNQIVSLDEAKKTLTVNGGVKYGEICKFLHEKGYALHNLASLPHISVAGSIATATHGSGILNGNLATAVSAIEFINANGDIVSLSRGNGDAFYGAVVGLGCLGPVSAVTLDLLPTFDMQQVVYRNLPFENLNGNFTEIMSGGYSVSLFTDWKKPVFNEVWVKCKIQNGGSHSFSTDYFGATVAVENLHPIEDQPAENCTEQCAVPGPWYERLPHFKMGFTPSAGAELQSEYFIPIEHAYEAMTAVRTLREKIAPHVFVSEIRTIDADSLWMSPCYKRRCVAFHTTWKQHPEVMELLPLIEKLLEPFEPIPHWGKLFTLRPEVLRSRLKMLESFRRLVQTHDPDGKFRNEFIQQALFSE